MFSLPQFKQALLVICIFIFLACGPRLAWTAELFVADRATDRILSFDESTGALLRVVTDTGLSVPSSLAFGPDGFLYATNLQSGFPGSAASVVKIDPVTGTTTPFITDVGGPGGIAYHAASNTLFVAEFGNFDGKEVFRYDATGKRIETLGTGSAATGRAGMAFDSVGNLYVSESNFSGVGSVLKYDAPAGSPSNPFGATATTFALGANATLQFPAPAGGFNGLAFDPNGGLFVASLIGQSVIHFPVSGGVAADGVSYGPPLAYPSSLLSGADGNLLVTNLGNDQAGDPFWGPNLFPGEVSRYTGFGGSAPLLVGDANRDDLVDGGDLTAIESGFGTDGGGDLSGDFDTDGEDVLLWQRGFGNEGVVGAFQPTAIVRYEPPLVGIAVPEPSAVALILSFAFCRRHLFRLNRR